MNSKFKLEDENPNELTPLWKKDSNEACESRLGHGETIKEDSFQEKLNQPISSSHSEFIRKSYSKTTLKESKSESIQWQSVITAAISCIIAWFLLYAFLNDEVKPGGQLFLLITLTLLSLLSGWVVSFLHLPPLLGMLICGIVMKNLGYFNITGVYLEIISTIREMALAMILLEAGLDIDLGTLKKLSFVIARLTIIPCLAETIGVAVASYYIADMPWLWGFLLGCVLSAVSPAIIIPALVRLKKQGYGEKKGIYTMVIAASSLDDIVSISFFGVILSMLFVQDSHSENTMGRLIQAPFEAGLGLIIGIGWGILAAFFPHQHEKYLICKRTLMIGGGGSAIVLLTSYMRIPGAGPLAAITLAFIAQVCWKWQGWGVANNPVADIFHTMWIVIQPLVFGLIGTDLDLQTIQFPFLKQALLVLLAGLLVRIASCCVILTGANLNLKEIVFINLAWIPKATVQATLGPIALEKATQLGLIEETEYAKSVLAVAVLSILVTAPIGMIGITLAGPVLLTRNDSATQFQNQTETERMNN